MSARPLILRNRSFACVWLGQVLSQGGTRMYQIALLWWIISSVKKDESGIAAGIFMVAGALPAVTLAALIGRIIERTPSRRVMMTAELTAGVAVAIIGVLLATTTLSLWMVYVAALVVALCQAFVDPTLTKAVPELVTPDDVESAIAFETSTQSIASFAGAVFGAVLVGRIGFVGVIIVNAASYVTSALLLTFARFRHATTIADSSKHDNGWRILDGMPFIKRVLVVYSAASFFATPTLLVLPLYTKAVLHADAGALAVLESCLWVGLSLGAFSSRLFKSTRHLTRLAAACLAGFALALALPAIVVSKPIYMTALVTGGWCLGVNNVKSVALFQAEVPDALKGRFFALMQAALSVTFPVAYLLFGALGGFVGPRALCGVQCVGVACSAIAMTTLRMPRGRGAPQQG